MSLASVSSLARPKFCQAPHFMSLNFAAMVMLSIYESLRSNLKPNLAGPPLISGSVPAVSCVC